MENSSHFQINDYLKPGRHAHLVGIGGVSRAEDVLEMMLAGATAVQVGAANLVNPFACRDIVRDLPAVMEKYGVTALTDIIGGAH